MTLTGFVTAPEYRTGTIADYSTAIMAGVTLYGGVLLGVLIGRRLQKQRNKAAMFKTTFLAGIAGAMAAITVGFVVGFLLELISTGRLMPKGNSPALLPIFYIVGGLLSSFIAAGAGLIVHAFAREAKNEPK